MPFGAQIVQVVEDFAQCVGDFLGGRDRQRDIDRLIVTEQDADGFFTGYQQSGRVP
jgi:hypothetical protein